jgi:hypothetical protein
MKLGVMQPYVFPYIGYFQLISAVDLFIFYDDVQFIKGGWVNRNRILLNGKDAYLTIPCVNKSPNKKINEINVNKTSKEFSNLQLTLKMAYGKAPYFYAVYPLLIKIFNSKFESISQLAINSVMTVCEYLNMDVIFKVSSIDFSENNSLDRSNRLIQICKLSGANNYINPLGGINLEFIKSNLNKYCQFSDDFIPALSIIDVLMFNSTEEVKLMLSNYTLE